ncbi:MAG: ATP-binding cassette domain-containing protein [SAR324 cluster bacterium]|nr:ATP-binding cassette domain-containing protein [SAR324 cluster bacterium]
MNRPILAETKALTKHYYSRHSWLKQLKSRASAVQAVNHIDLHIGRGETLGLIGESGCGKSTLGRTLLRLHEPTSGQVFFDEQEITHLSFNQMKNLRKRMQIIFQDPYASLNPRMSVEEIISLPLKIHESLPQSELQARVREIAARVGLNTAQLQRYPHQFSGGQRQRIGIARALVTNPDFIVCDEPVSALDVSIQAQVIRLLEDLRKEFSLTYLLISHDISVVGYLSDRIAVMYLGEIVEQGPTKSLLSNPKHPYTQALLEAIPRVDHLERPPRIVLKGDLPSPLNPPSGCKFHTRCPHVIEQCSQIAPEQLTEKNGHFVKCFLFSEQKNE